MGKLFSRVSHAVTGSQPLKPLSPLQHAIEHTINPMINNLNKVVAPASNRRFHMLITQGRNAWDFQPHLKIIIGHFAPTEYKAAQFFNQNPYKIKTPEGMDFNGINNRAYTFSAIPIASTTPGDGPRGLYHFAAWQKISDPQAPHYHGLRILQGKTLHIAAHEQPSFTQNIHDVLKSAATYLEFKTGRPVALQESSGLSVTRQRPAAPRHSTTHPRAS